MSISFVATDEVAAIRNRIDHPIIDGDGHLIEYLPVVKDIIRDIADPSVAERFQRVIDGSKYSRMVPPDKRRESNTKRSRNDFAVFETWLENVVRLKRDEAASLDPRQAAWDILLHEHEPESNAAVCWFSVALLAFENLLGRIFVAMGVFSP